MHFKKRIDTIKKNISGKEALFYLNKEDIYYLSGFNGSYGFLILTKDESFLLVDGRYFEKAKRESIINNIISPTDFLEELRNILTSLKIEKLYFDGETVSYSLYKKIKEALKDIVLEEDKDRLVKKLREIKDGDEVKIISEGAQRSKKAFDEFIKSSSLLDKKERECVNELEFRLKMYGENVSFDTIVLAGKNSSLPHGTAGERKIRKKDSVIIDFGLKFKNYCTDHTRSLIFDNIKMEKYLKIVKRAFDAGLERIADGNEIKEVDIAVRKVFEQEGVLNNFLHSSGHGIGLAVHESPTISYKTKGSFKKGMIVTLEPGLYFEGIGGVRFEEMILVTKNGCVIL